MYRTIILSVVLWVRALVARIKGRTEAEAEAEAVGEYGAEEDIWVYGGEGNKRLEENK